MHTKFVTLCMVLVLAARLTAAEVPPSPAPAATPVQNSDLPEPIERVCDSQLVPRWAPWDKSAAGNYQYMVQEPPKISADSPILIYMHCAGGDRHEGMGLARQGEKHTNPGWLLLRKELLGRGWIYVCPDHWEFDGLQEDLKKKYGEHPVYLMGGSWGGHDVFEEARFKLQQNPKAYAGVALLASMINNDGKGDDNGPGAVTARDFPVPVYMAVSDGEGKIGGAMYKLYLKLRAAGGTVHMDIFTRSTHPPINGIDWKVLLDHVSGGLTGKHLLQQWTFTRGAKKEDSQVGEYSYAATAFGGVSLRTLLDPLPPDSKCPDQTLIPEPLQRKPGEGCRYWFTESLQPYPENTPALVVVPETSQRYLQAFGMADSRMKNYEESTIGAGCIMQARRKCFNAGWPYIIAQKGTAEQLLSSMRDDVGKRDLHIVGIVSGGDMALELTKAGGTRVRSLIIVRPSVELIAKLSEVSCPVAITTAGDADPGLLAAAKAFLAARTNNKLAGLWMTDQGQTAMPPGDMLDIHQWLKQLEIGGVRQQQCESANPTPAPEKALIKKTE